MSPLFLSVHMFVPFCKIEAFFSTMRRECQDVIDTDYIRKMVQPALLRLCIALSIATVLVLLLASIPVFALFAPGRSIFLIGSIVCWGILFDLYSHIISHFLCFLFSTFVHAFPLSLSFFIQCGGCFMSIEFHLN